MHSRMGGSVYSKAMRKSTVNKLETLEEDNDEEDESHLDHFKSYVLAWLSMILYSFAHIILA